MKSRGFPFVKLFLLAVVGYGAWTWGLPWYQSHFGSSRGSSQDGGTTASGRAGGPCTELAERASLAWGNGIGRFVNPPQDVSAWSSFRSDVSGRISDAKSACSCGTDSCTKAKGAMDDLDSMVVSIDSAIRSGVAFSADVVRQQEKIDATIEEAKTLFRQGR